MNSTSRARLQEVGIISNPDLPPDQQVEKPPLAKLLGNRGGRPRTRVRKKKARVKKGLVGRPISRLPGLNSPIEQHPKKDEIDQALLYNQMPRLKMVEVYGFSLKQLTYRKMMLRKRVKMVSLHGQDPVKNREVKQAAQGLKKTIDLLEWPLKAAMAGNKTAMEEKKLGAAKDFITVYLDTVQKYGEIKGELAPAGQTLVNQDNRMLTITALPRASDPQSVIDASEALVRLPAPQGS